MATQQSKEIQKNKQDLPVMNSEEIQQITGNAIDAVRWVKNLKGVDDDEAKEVVRDVLYAQFDNQRKKEKTDIISMSKKAAEAKPEDMENTEDDLWKPGPLEGAIEKRRLAGRYEGNVYGKSGILEHHFSTVEKGPKGDRIVPKKVNGSEDLTRKLKNADCIGDWTIITFVQEIPTKFNPLMKWEVKVLK